MEYGLVILFVWACLAALSDDSRDDADLITEYDDPTDDPTYWI